MPASLPGTTATITLEVAWGYTSETKDSSLSWTDESSYLVQFDSTSGRPSEFELAQAGTMTVVLRNDSRRFDPTYTSGAIYSSLSGKVGHPIRIRATYSAVTYDIWRGFVERIEQAWDQQAYGNRYASAVLTCSDALADLNIATLPDSAWSVEVLRGVKFEDDGSAVPDPPIHWWRLGEQSGTVMRDSTPLATPGAANGTYAGTVGATYNYRQGLCAGSPDGAIEFDGVDMHATLPSATWTPPFTVVACLVLTTASKTNPIVLVDPAGSATFSFSVNSSNFLTVTYHDGTDTRSATASTTALAVDTPYVVACAVPAAAAPKLWVNTTSQTVSSSGSGTLDAITGTGYVARNGTDYFSGILDEVIVYDFDAIALNDYNGNPSRINDFADVRSDAWDQDTFQLRTKKILDNAAHPVDLRDIATSSTWEYDPAEFAGMTAGQYLAEVAKAEDGFIYAGPDGKVYCEDRRSRFVNTRSTASQATVGETGTYLWSQVTADGQDASWVRNRIVARRKFGSDLVAQDATYKRGQAEDLGTLMLRSEANVQALLNRRLTARKTPLMRFTTVQWSPRANGGQWALLARKISDRVTVQHTPMGIGNQISQTSWIEGVAHSMSVRTGRWDVTWNLSPTISDPD